jgi:hypothetical protein
MAPSLKATPLRTRVLHKRRPTSYSRCAGSSPFALSSRSVAVAAKLQRLLQGVGGERRQVV